MVISGVPQDVRLFGSCLDVCTLGKVVVVSVVALCLK